MTTRAVGLWVAGAFFSLGCHSRDMSKEKTPRPPRRRPPPRRAQLVGGIERLDPALDALVAPDARPEVLAQGYKWSEGPVWTGGALLFSDVPNNVIWRWKEGEGAREFLRPSGYTGTRPARRRAGIERPGRRRRAAACTCASTATGASRASQRRRQVVRDDRRSLRGQALQQPQRCGGALERRRLLHRPDLRPRRAREGSGARDPLERRLPRARRRRRRRARQDADLTRTASRSRPTARRCTSRCRIRRARSGWPTTSTPGGGVANGRVFFDATSFVKAGKKGLPDGHEDRRRRQPVRDRPGRRVRVLAGGQAPRHHRDGRADRELRVRRRRPHAVHDRERQADAHPPEDARGRRRSRHGVRARPQTPARPGRSRGSAGCRRQAAATTTCCSARWRC